MQISRIFISMLTNPQTQRVPFQTHPQIDKADSFDTAEEDGVVGAACFK